MTRGSGTRHSTANGNMETLDGKDPNNLPNSQGHLQGGIGLEVGDNTPYCKTHAERAQSQQEEKSKADEKV